MPKKHDLTVLTPEQRAIWDAGMREFDLGGPARKAACYALGIFNSDFMTEDYEVALYKKAVKS